MNVVLQGYGTGQRVLTQGYGFAAITISLSPFGPTVAVNSTTTFTSSVPANWTLTGVGSLVVAPDGLSAVYTAPSSPGSATITIADQTNPGNTLSAPITVTTLGPLTVGELVPPGDVGRSVING